MSISKQKLFSCMNTSKCHLCLSRYNTLKGPIILCFSAICLLGCIWAINKTSLARFQKYIEEEFKSTIHSWQLEKINMRHIFHSFELKMKFTFVYKQVCAFKLLSCQGRCSLFSFVIKLELRLTNIWNFWALTGKIYYIYYFALGISLNIGPKNPLVTALGVICLSFL